MDDLLRVVPAADALARLCSFTRLHSHTIQSTMVNAPVDAKTAAPVAAPAIIKDLKCLKLSDGPLVSSAGKL